MVDTIDTATVLVTENVKRTQKLLMAIGQGKPICSPNWIRQSKAAGQFLGNLNFNITSINYMGFLWFL